MKDKQLLALIGFAFAFVWIVQSLGDAVLCLLAAGVFYAVGSYLQGELDLSEAGDRLRGRGGGGSQGPPAPPSRPRVR